MTSESSQTPADIPLESSFETAVNMPLPGQAGPTKGPVGGGPGFDAVAVTTALPGGAAAQSGTVAQTGAAAQSGAAPGGSSGVARSEADRPPAIPDVTLEKTLGQGGMGTVYKGRQITLDRAVAVKAIHPALAKDRTFVDRFEREAKVLAKLSHPNIVTCYAAGTCKETGKHYLLMEYVEGEDLLKRVKKAGPLAERDALVIAKQVAEGLEHALEAGVIHRDVKPENILLKPVQGRAATSLGVQAKIVDLGLAALAQPDKESLRLTEAGTALGTPLTMAPEQAEAPDSIDHRVDIYALGCTLFYALTARFPHEGTTIAQVLSKKLRDETPDPRTLRPELGESTSKLILEMMSFAVAKRPPTYENLVARFDAEIARLPSLSTKVPSTKAPVAQATTPSAPSMSAPQAPPRRSLLLPALGAGVVAAVAFAAFAQFHSQGGPTTPPVAVPTPVTPPAPLPAPTPTPVTPPAPAPVVANPNEPPAMTWTSSGRFFGDADANRFANLELVPQDAWKKVGDDDEFADFACNVDAKRSPALAWYKPAIDTAVRIEGVVGLRTLTEEAGVRLDFGTDTVDVIADCVEARNAAKDAPDLARTWKLLVLLGSRGPLGAPLASRTYAGTPNIHQRVSLVVARGSIWARLEDRPDTKWVVGKAPGKLVRVGLCVTKPVDLGAASFKEFRVDSAHD